MTLLTDSIGVQATANCCCGWMLRTTSADPGTAQDAVRRYLADHIGSQHPKDKAGDRGGMPGVTKAVIELRVVETLTPS
jgi:hypothetical protein